MTNEEMYEVIAEIAKRYLEYRQFREAPAAVLGSTTVAVIRELLGNDVAVGYIEYAEEFFDYE